MTYFLRTYILFCFATNYFLSHVLFMLLMFYVDNVTGNIYVVCVCVLRYGIFRYLLYSFTYSFVRFIKKVYMQPLRNQFYREINHDNYYFKPYSFLVIMYLSTYSIINQFYKEFYLSYYFLTGIFRNIKLYKGL